MRTLLLIFACKRPKYADTGGGGHKTVKFCGRPLWMAPNVICKIWIYGWRCDTLLIISIKGREMLSLLKHQEFYDIWFPEVIITLDVYHGSPCSMPALLAAKEEGLKMLKRFHMSLTIYHFGIMFKNLHWNILFKCFQSFLVILSYLRWSVLIYLRYSIRLGGGGSIAEEYKCDNPVNNFPTVESSEHYKIS